jgi:predicted O-methyltransferase YrrM
VRARQHEWECTRRLRRGLRSLSQDPCGSEELWHELVEGWDNNRWSAGVEYLDAVAAASSRHEGPILECGSGLTTLVLATMSRRTGSQIWTLEHDERCFRIVQSRLRRFGLTANVQLTPLRDYALFDWYDVAPLSLPSFSLVVCDGPPSATRGGRFGLVPVLRDNLDPGCAILLDDARRPGEREVLERWSSEFGLEFEIRGETKLHAWVRQPGAAA